MIFFFKLLSKRVESDQLSFLINGLIDALNDAQSHSSSGACVVLNSLFRIRGAELGGEVGLMLMYRNAYIKYRLGHIEEISNACIYIESISMCLTCCVSSFFLAF